MLAVATAVLATGRPALADTEITTCGQVIPSGAAYLTADLDCAGTGAFYGVKFDGTGVVDLRGFTIRNANVAIACDGNCNVRNGSMIDNLTNVSGARVKLRDVVIGGGSNHAEEAYPVSQTYCMKTTATWLLSPS